MTLTDEQIQQLREALADMNRRKSISWKKTFEELHISDFSIELEEEFEKERKRLMALGIEKQNPTVH